MGVDVPELNEDTNKAEMYRSDTSADIASKSQKCHLEDNVHDGKRSHTPSKKHCKKDHHMAPRLCNVPKESTIIPLLLSNAVCAGCGLSTSHAYQCKFCAATIQIFCSIDQEELG
jgi:hypothetical protein